MSRIPDQTLNAPTGIDLTSDPVAMDESRAQMLVNLQADRAGTLRANATLTNLLQGPRPAPIQGVAFYPSATLKNGDLPPFQADLLIFVSAGNLYYCIVTVPFGVVTLGPPVFVAGVGQINYPGTYFSGLFFVNQRLRSAMFLTELLLVQGQGVQMQRFVLVGGVPKLYQAGITTPGAAPTVTAQGTGYTGTVQYRFTLYDELLRESSPSAASSPLALANQAGHVVFLPASDTLARVQIDRQVKGAYVYRTLDGGSVFYRIRDVPSTSFNSVAGTIMSPDDFAADVVVASGAICPNPNEYDVPNPASIIAVHKNHVFLNDVTDNATLQVSVLNSGTQFTSVPNAPVLATDGARFRVSTDQGDPIVALVELGSLLGVFKRRSVSLLYGDDITDFTVRPVHLRGCVAPDSVVRCDNTILYLSDDGVYAIGAEGDAAQVNKVSKEIEVSLLANSRQNLEAAQGWFVNNRYNLSVGTTVYVFDFDAKGWSTQTFGSDSFPLALPGYPTLNVGPLAPPSPTAPVPPVPPVPAASATVVGTPHSFSLDAFAGPNDQAMTFAIPAGVWTSATWNFDGLITNAPFVGDSTSVTTAGGGIGAFGNLPNGAYTAWSAGASTSLVAINAAAGGNLTVHFLFSGAIGQIAVTAVRLVLTA